MHKHKAKSKKTTPFFGPVSGTRKQNPAAHGNVTVIAKCRCGAERSTNVNGPHVERGQWSSPEGVLG